MTFKSDFPTLGTFVHITLQDSQRSPNPPQETVAVALAQVPRAQSICAVLSGARFGLPLPCPFARLSFPSHLLLLLSRFLLPFPVQEFLLLLTRHVSELLISFILLLLVSLGVPLLLLLLLINSFQLSGLLLARSLNPSHDFWSEIRLRGQVIGQSQESVEQG